MEKTDLDKTIKGIKRFAALKTGLTIAGTAGLSYAYNNCIMVNNIDANQKRLGNVYDGLIAAIKDDPNMSEEVKAVEIEKIKKECEKKLKKQKKIDIAAHILGSFGLGVLSGSAIRFIHHEMKSDIAKAIVISKKESSKSKK